MFIVFSLVIAWNACPRDLYPFPSPVNVFVNEDISVFMGTLKKYNHVLVHDGPASFKAGDKTNWNSNADINGDGVADIFDSTIIGLHSNERQ